MQRLGLMPPFQKKKNSVNEGDKPEEICSYADAAY
jgi:hypothetical protein